MFVFYYGIMADLSPPVALAALAAAPIAKENPDKIGWEAMRIALAGYVIPFIFVYSPALMLQAGDPMAAKLGFYGAVALATFKALVAIGLFGIVAIGFLFTRLTLFELAVSSVAALCLLGDFPFSDTIGFALSAAANSKARASPAAEMSSTVSVRDTASLITCTGWPSSVPMVDVLHRRAKMEPRASGIRRRRTACRSPRTKLNPRRASP